MNKFVEKSSDAKYDVYTQGTWQLIVQKKIDGTYNYAMLTSDALAMVTIDFYTDDNRISYRFRNLAMAEEDISAFIEDIQYIKSIVAEVKDLLNTKYSTKYRQA